MQRRKEKYIVLAQFDEKGPVEVLVTRAEDRDVACHQAEIANGWGSFIALDERQVRRIVKDLGNYLRIEYATDARRKPRCSTNSGDTRNPPEFPRIP